LWKGSTYIRKEPAESLWKWKKPNMRYKAQPQSFPERFALWTGMVPMPLVDSLFPLVKARSLMAGVRLGVFEALKEGPLDDAALAERLGLDRESLELLLRVLTASEYLTVRKGRFGLTAMARKTLVTGAAMDSRGYVEFNYTQWEFLERLEDLLRSGRGIDFHHTMRDAGAWENYQRGMLELAACTLPCWPERSPCQRARAPCWTSPAPTGCWARPFAAGIRP
jgi:hypothetical protein